MLVPLDQPGIEIREIWTMGDERTNEVFIEDVFVPDDYVVGEVGKGFQYISQALDLELLNPECQILFGVGLRKHIARWGQNLGADQIGEHRQQCPDGEPVVTCDLLGQPAHRLATILLRRTEEARRR